MSIAERTRTAAQRHPFLIEALRSGVLNYTAAARFLDIGETDAVAAALRRYAEDLPAASHSDADIKLRMITGVGKTDDTNDSLLVIDGESFATGIGELTAIVADGPIPMRGYVRALWRLEESSIPIRASGTSEQGLIVVTDRNGGPNALRIVEESLAPDSRD